MDAFPAINGAWLTWRNRHAPGLSPAQSTRTFSGAGWKQFLLPDLQCLRKEDNFGVGYTADLGLNFGNRVFTNVPACPRTTRGQHRLRPALSVTNFSHGRPDNILRNGFAHNFALTVCEPGPIILPISEGTSCVEKQIRCFIIPNWQVGRILKETPTNFVGNPL